MGHGSKDLEDKVEAFWYNTTKLQKKKSSFMKFFKFSGRDLLNKVPELIPTPLLF